MAFEASGTEFQSVNGGEIWVTSPHAVTNYTDFEDGTEVGRFAQIKSGVLSNLDDTATPDLAGLVLRNIGGVLEDGTTITAENGQYVDVLDFGRGTVYVPSGITPTEGGDVYAVNDTSADAGKATTDTGALAIPDAVFYKEIKAGVWLVTLKQYMK